MAPAVADAALGAALRAGHDVAIAGAALGGVMTRPTDAQLADARVTGHLTSPARTRSALPTAAAGCRAPTWSPEHGDLRVPHFLGLHALQALPLVAFAIGGLRRVRAEVRLQLVRVAAASYAALAVILTWQALRGQSVVAPDAVTLAAIAAWVAGTALAAAVVTLRRPVEVSSRDVLAASGR